MRIGRESEISSQLSRGAASVDHDKVALLVKRKQSVVPGAFCIIDTFTLAARKMRIVRSSNCPGAATITR